MDILLSPSLVLTTGSIGSFNFSGFGYYKDGIVLYRGRLDDAPRKPSRQGGM